MSITHATRAPGGIVAVPEHLIPALRAAAHEQLADICRKVADLYDQEPLGRSQQYRLAVDCIEEHFGAVTRLDGQTTGLTMPAGRLEMVVSHALRMQDHDAEALREEHTAEAFDELERRAHITRRLRMLHHDLTTTPKAA